jgi:hypothetical protein
MIAIYVYENCSFCSEHTYTIEIPNNEYACIGCIEKAIETTKENERIDEWFSRNLREY